MTKYPFNHWLALTSRWPKWHKVKRKVVSELFILWWKFMKHFVVSRISEESVNKSRIIKKRLTDAYVSNTMNREVITKTNWWIVMTWWWWWWSSCLSVHLSVCVYIYITYSSVSLCMCVSVSFVSSISFSFSISQRVSHPLSPSVRGFPCVCVSCLLCCVCACVSYLVSAAVCRRLSVRVCAD